MGAEEPCWINPMLPLISGYKFPNYFLFDAFILTSPQGEVQMTHSLRLSICLYVLSSIYHYKPHKSATMALGAVRVRTAVHLIFLSL